jgi:hypothetical protein
MSSRHNRRAASAISGRSAPATRRVCGNPARSECAITASITAVRGCPSGPGRSGVACVSTTEPTPSPSTISIVTVRGSGQLKAARTGTPSRRPRVKVTSTRKRSSAGGHSSGGALSTLSSANEYGCSQAPCHGSSRLATTSSGSQRPIAVATAATLRPRSGRGPRTGAAVAASPAVASRTQARTPSSCAGNVRQPGRPSAPRSRPCQRQISRPSCTGASHSAAPRCGQAPGPARSVPSVSRHATTSRPPTIRPKARPGRISRLPAITNHPPDGRACARCSAARMIPGLASAQVDRCWAQAGRDSTRSGWTGSRLLTAPRLGPSCRAGTSSPCRPRTGHHSHWLRRKTRNSSAHRVPIVISTIG